MKRLLILAALALLVSCNVKTNESCDWSRSVVYELNTRQFTPEGTFCAAAQQLPRLKELGVDIVWVMPLYPIGEKGRKGTLGSYYAIKDYCNVNPEFGTLDDFDSFLNEAHSLGMKVIIDWVANHTSPDHPWVTEKPSDWYIRDAEGNTIVEYDWTDIAKLNYENKDMRRAMKDAMKFWLDRGIDGYRCDMAALVPQDFWTETISYLRSSVKRPLYFLAEAEEPWMYKAGFDATYSWRLHHLINDIAAGKASVEDLQEYNKWNEETFPQGALRLCFTSNHDENSWAGTEFERLGKRWKELTRLIWSQPNAQMLIYTGQEIGYDHRFLFFEKDPVPAWSTNEYSEFYKAETERFHRRPIDHMDPPCWWVGMKTDLQIMVHGEDISSYNISAEGLRGVRVDAIHKAESPNYVFIDISIAKNAEPGTFQIVFSRPGDTFRVAYELREREDGSAQRGSFGPKDAVYLIMPDRFANGDSANDDSFDTNEKADKNAFFGRHGGDIKGIEQQLDYIADLGMTAIWCTPLLMDNELKESYHGYACGDYYRIDPRIGSNEDYRALVAAAHEKGLKFIMDIVTNHCGSQHWWMADLPFGDWIHQWDEYTHSNCAFSMQTDTHSADVDVQNMQGGWFDRTMPDMNLDNPYVLQYFKQMAIWWAEWAGLDGFRVDTYPYNEKYPMAQWCAAVREEYPNLNIVGEVWNTNVAQVSYWQGGHSNPDGFDSHLPSVMDFCLHGAVCGSINENHEDWDNGITKVYDVIANDFFFADPSNIMIFPGNHDTWRIADIAGGDIAKLKIVMTLMATLRGYPQIFAGDELGVRSRDLSQGHGGLRVEFPSNWAENPSMKSLHDYTRTLLEFRKSCPALQTGEMTHYLGRDNTYAYFRYDSDSKVFVFINNNDKPVRIPWEKYSQINSGITSGVNIVTGQTVDFSKDVFAGAKESLILNL